MKKLYITGYPNAPSEDSDQTVNAQAYLILRWEQTSEGKFTDVAAHII